MSCQLLHKKFTESSCKMTPVLKSLCKNECIFRNVKLKRYTCNIIPKEQYCVRPICQTIVLDSCFQPCICNSQSNKVNDLKLV
jgi:hypothetical protein